VTVTLTKNPLESHSTCENPLHFTHSICRRSLYTITGRPDAPGCDIAQPNFTAALAAKNVIFRIPTPTVGLGLVELVSDLTLETNFAANGALKSQLGISGKFNISANDHTITRFGWKAQNKSLLMFSGEAYNVEIGVTNELFPNERDTTPSCQFNPPPEDMTIFGTTDPVSPPTGSTASDFSTGQLCHVHASVGSAAAS
jgi:Di-haem oxidoreductase, putative peroxidase